MTRKAVLRYINALNRHDPDEIAACVAPDFHNEHTSVAGTSLRGRDSYRERLSAFLGEFAGLSYDIEDVIVEGERAAVPYRMSFIYNGTPVRIRGIFRFRVANDLIAHRVDYWDGADFERQISR